VAATVNGSELAVDSSARVTLKPLETSSNFSSAVVVNGCMERFLVIGPIDLGYDWRTFVVAAGGGPLLAYGLYRIATEHHRTHADVIH
jgi:hypothetical protein